MSKKQKCIELIKAFSIVLKFMNYVTYMIITVLQ